jgi:tRNA (guanine-N1)-methyltransferase
MGKGKTREVYIDDTNIPLLNIPSISSLHNEKQMKVTSSNDIYKTVLNKCIEKIVYTNRHTDKSFIIFEVPKILTSGHHQKIKEWRLEQAIATTKERRKDLYQKFIDNLKK